MAMLAERSVCYAGRPTGDVCHRSSSSSISLHCVLALMHIKVDTHGQLTARVGFLFLSIWNGDRPTPVAYSTFTLNQ